MVRKVNKSKKQTKVEVPKEAMDVVFRRHADEVEEQTRIPQRILVDFQAKKASREKILRRHRKIIKKDEEMAALLKALHSNMDGLVSVTKSMMDKGKVPESFFKRVKEVQTLHKDGYAFVEANMIKNTMRLEKAKAKMESVDKVMAELRDNLVTMESSIPYMVQTDSNLGILASRVDLRLREVQSRRGTIRSKAEEKTKEVLRGEIDE